MARTIISKAKSTFIDENKSKSSIDPKVIADSIISSACRFMALLRKNLSRFLHHLERSSVVNAAMYSSPSTASSSLARISLTALETYSCRNQVIDKWNCYKGTILLDLFPTFQRFLPTFFRSLRITITFVLHEALL